MATVAGGSPETHRGAEQCRHDDHRRGLELGQESHAPRSLADEAKHGVVPAARPVARAPALRRSVLLADEPTSELDATTRQPLVALMRAEADAGAVVLMGTHDSWCVDQADAEYHLDEGRIRQVRSAPVLARRPRRRS